MGDATLQSGGTPAVKEQPGTVPMEATVADAPATPVAGQATTAQPKEEKEQETEEPLDNIEDLKKELEGYIGLSVIKKEVQSLINLVTVQKLRKQNDLPVEDLSLHMVFSATPAPAKR